MNYTSEQGVTSVQGEGSKFSVGRYGRGDGTLNITGGSLVVDSEQDAIIGAATDSTAAVGIVNVSGGGIQIILGADIRLATPEARFSVMEIKWGIIPDMSITQTLRDLVRLDVAKELTFTGKIVSADEAVQLGLITRICDDPLTEARKLAREIAGKSPHAIVAAKRLLDNAWHGTAKEGLMLEESLQRTLIGTPNQTEAVAANFEKRTPNFTDRER